MRLLDLIEEHHRIGLGADAVGELPAALIVARMLGFTAPGLSEAEVLKLWSILEVGIGGYVIGRSAEKILPEVAKALGNRPR